MEKGRATRISKYLNLNCQRNTSDSRSYQENTLRPRKVILVIFMCLALISFVAGVLVDFYFSQHYPREPEPEFGRIYRVVSNKTPIYVTKHELMALHLPGISFFVWFGALAYFGVRWKLMQVAVKEPEFSAQFSARRQVTKKKGDSS